MHFAVLVLLAAAYTSAAVPTDATSAELPLTPARPAPEPATAVAAPWLRLELRVGASTFSWFEPEMASLFAPVVLPTGSLRVQVGHPLVGLARFNAARCWGSSKTCGVSELSSEVGFGYRIRVSRLEVTPYAALNLREVTLDGSFANGLSVQVVLGAIAALRVNSTVLVLIDASGEVAGSPGRLPEQRPVLYGNSGRFSAGVSWEL